MTIQHSATSVKHLPHADAKDDMSIEYPSSDGEPMAESKWQYVPLTDTVSALENHFLHRPDVFIAGDMLVYYRMNDNQTRVAPDVFAVFGATGKHLRDSWLIWREGKAPDFVMEIASPSTWQRDVLQKRTIYANMGVTEYWRFDPTGECFHPSLAAEQLVAAEYRPIPLHTEPDAAEGQAVLWGHSAVLGLDICVLPGLELRLYDPVSRQWLLTHRESEAARIQEAQARQSAEAARQSAEAARQSAESARQSAESARIQESQARQSAEAALRAAEEENRRLLEQLRSRQSGQ